MAHVIPAIIPKSFAYFEEHVALVKEYVSRVQVDILDGAYAPTTTWPYVDESLPRLPEGIAVELDMMVEHPERVIDTWIAAGITAAIIHIESTQEHMEVVRKLRESQVEVVFALKPSTPNEELFALIEGVGGVDAVQCMGNDNIGYHGVELDAARVLPKVQEIRERYPDMPLAVDIGINKDTAPALVDAGVTRLVSGSALFGSDDLSATIQWFESL